MSWSDFFKPRSDGRAEPQSPPRIEPMSLYEAPKPVLPRKGTLAAVVGIGAAAALLTLTPHEESGRTVKADVAADGTATVTHVKGPQYLKSYRDVASIATACDGITRGVKMGQTYTEAQCTALLEKELIIHAEGVMACTPGLKAEARSNQRVAAVLLAYNIGVAGYCKSTAAKRFNAGDYRGGCDAFLSWNKARVGGVLRPVQGLTNRRQREMAICKQGL